MGQENTVFIALEDGAKMPERASSQAAGFDLYAFGDTVIEPGQTVIVPTGIRIAMPPGLEAQVRPRSGLSLRTSLRIANTPGTIDADYRGVVSIICENTAPLFDPVPYLLKHPEILESFHRHYQAMPAAAYFKKLTGYTLPLTFHDPTIFVDEEGHPLGSIYVHRGDRIAQLVFSEVTIPVMTAVDDVAAIGSDRGGGFGSTGV
ncbi:MAG TPA: aminotransferase [Bacillota bacterium]|nr:aminotransferase [Bacillota bacterium]